MNNISKGILFTFNEKKKQKFSFLILAPQTEKKILKTTFFQFGNELKKIYNFVYLQFFYKPHFTCGQHAVKKFRLIIYRTKNRTPCTWRCGVFGILVHFASFCSSLLRPTCDLSSHLDLSWISGFLHMGDHVSEDLKCFPYGGNKKLS